MTKILFVLVLLLPASVLADDRLLGVWQSEDGNTRLDIFDGFKPNRGAVLITENNKETEIWYWETRADTTTLAIGGIIGKVKFRGSDTIEWAYDRVFKKQTGIKEDNVALLKKDEPLPIRLTHTPTRDRFCVYNG